MIGSRHSHIYVDGVWQESDSDAFIDLTDPATEDWVGSVPDGSPADVASAAMAAHAALRGGPKRHPKIVQP